MKKLILFLSILILHFNSFSQTKYNAADYTKKPVWIAMMDDEHVNYFETLKA